MTMSKSTLFVLAGFLLVSVAFGGDVSGRGRSPLHGKTPKVPVTAAQACVAKGHRSACRELPRNLCSNFKCLSSRGKVVSIGQAPDDMWCAPYQVCRNGRCTIQQGIPEPTEPGTYVNCKN